MISMLWINLSRCKFWGFIGLEKRQADTIMVCKILHINFLPYNFVIGSVCYGYADMRALEIVGSNLAHKDENYISSE